MLQVNLNGGFLWSKFNYLSIWFFYDQLPLNIWTCMNVRVLIAKSSPLVHLRPRKLTKSHLSFHSIMLQKNGEDQFVNSIREASVLHRFNMEVREFSIRRLAAEKRKVLQEASVLQTLHQQVCVGKVGFFVRTWVHLSWVLGSIVWTLSSLQGY